MHQCSPVAIIASRQEMGADDDEIETPLELQGDGIVGADVGQMVGVDDQRIDHPVMIVAEVEHRGAREVWKLIHQRVPLSSGSLHGLDGRREVQKRGSSTAKLSRNWMAASCVPVMLAE